MSFTVAICTHNRAASLRRALRSLEDATKPDADWSVLVVLNDCADDSRAVAEAARATLPLALAAEPCRGLSHARNCAVEGTAAEAVVFIDDDAVVHRDFLVAYAEAFRRWPEADVFGGAIVPVFEGTPPNWLLDALPVVASAYAGREVEADGASITPAVLPFGTNYAMRMRRQRSLVYDPRLGRGGVDWIRNGEETSALLGALAQGATGRWVAGAKVDHVVPPDRQTADYLWRYFEGSGRLLRLQGRRRTGLPARALLSGLAYRWARLTAPPQRWAKAMVRAAVRHGEWKASGELRSGRASPIEPAAKSR